MGVSTKEYSNGEVTIIWNSSKCMHSEKCVKGLSSVFNINSSPWINPNGASTEEIIAQVAKCPSGALSIKKEEVKLPKPTDEEVVADNGIVSITATENGPYEIIGNFTLMDKFGNPIQVSGATYLCRCGNSQNKPFCDSSHRRVKFIG